jgi:adhesin transport system outer membrane protein
LKGSSEKGALQRKRLGKQMKPWSHILSILVFLSFLVGCGAHLPKQRDQIVLLPDPDGKVGVIKVTTEGGSQILDKPGYATQVEDLSKPPGAPQPINEKEMMSVFGPALSAQPDLTSRFIQFILYFESDTTKLTHEAEELLREVVKTIKSRKSKEIYVLGHTDRVGTEEYNIKLSSRRAYYVRDRIIFNGIKSSALVVSFHGEAVPLVYTEDDIPEPRNRRVEVIVR